MRLEFVTKVLGTLLEEGLMSLDDRILTVCAGPAECALFEELGFSRVLHSGFYFGSSRTGNTGTRAVAADILSLPFVGSSFDYTFVSDGLHHCSSPHSALGQMYLAAKKGVIVIESRDSLLVRLATRCGLAAEYELQMVSR